MIVGPRLRRAGQHHGLGPDGEEPGRDLRASRGRLADRLMAALKAGQAGGGDKRGHADRPRCSWCAKTAAISAPTTGSSTSGSMTRRIRSPSWSGCSRCTSCTSSPASRATCCRSRRPSSRSSSRSCWREPANQPKKWLASPQGSATPAFLEALRDFMYWENYDVRVRMDGKIDRVVLEDILKKRTTLNPEASSVATATPATPLRRARTRHQLLRPPARALDPVLHRDVGALQLLRHARAPHPVHDGAGGRGRAGVRHRQGRRRSTASTSPWCT